MLTWNEYYRTVADAMDAPNPELVHIPTDVLRRVAPDRTEMLAAHFQYSTVFDTTKARRDLDFEQTVPWPEGARRTIERLEAPGRIREAEAVERDDRLIEEWRATVDGYVAANRDATADPE